MTTAMRHVSDAIPLTHVINAMQDPWIGFGFNGFEMLIVLAMTLPAGAISLGLLRSE